MGDHPHKELDEIARHAEAIPRRTKDDRTDRQDKKNKESRSSSDRDKGSKSDQSSSHRGQDARGSRGRDNRGSSVHSADTNPEVNALSHGENSAQKASPSTQNQPPQCRYCLGDHLSTTCSFLSGMPKQDRDRLMKAREANDQHRCRINSWSKPSRPPQSQASRGSPSVSFADDESRARSEATDSQET